MRAHLSAAYRKHSQPVVDPEVTQLALLFLKDVCWSND